MRRLRKLAAMKLTAHLFRGIVRAYQLLITPILPGTCRYHPTCSQYALDSVVRFGALQGAWLTLKRILRCHPWGAHGYDPVPDELNTSDGRHLSPNQQPIKQ